MSLVIDMHAYRVSVQRVLRREQSLYAPLSLLPGYNQAAAFLPLSYKPTS